MSDDNELLARIRAGAINEFAALEPHWLHTEDGSDCVVLFQAARLVGWPG